MTAGLMLLAFLAGMVAVEFLIHRPDRANREVLAASDAAEIARLNTMLASAEADLRALEFHHDRAVDDTEWAQLREALEATRADAAEVALRFAVLRADGVASLEAARLARGRS